MVYRREKIKLNNGTVIKEKEWLEHWKKAHKEEVDGIRERLKKEHPESKEKHLEDLVDAEIIEPVWEGPEIHSDGSHLIHYQDYKGWDMKEDEPEDKLELEEKDWDKLYEVLNNLKYGDMVKMRYGLDGYEKMTLLQIANKTGYSFAGIHRALKIALKILRDALKK